MNRSFCSAVVMSAFSMMVVAQTVSAQDATPDAGPPPVDCPKPAGVMPVKGTKTEMAQYQKRIDDYKACVNVYAAANMTKAKELQAQAQALQTQAQNTQTKAQSTQTQAQAYATAANGAIDEFNAYVTALNRQGEEAAKK